MCHEYTSRAWDRESEPVDAEDEDDEAEPPEFMNEDAPDEVELLTDGGDE